MKIALLTKYGDLAASTRQRFQQYSGFLQASGFELLQRPLLDNTYLKRLYEGARRDNSHVFACYLDRLMWLITGPDVDLIWLHCELFPFLPALSERFARCPGKPIIFDYDDAIFHNYDQHRNSLVRKFLGKKLKSTIGGAELVMAGNAYLADYARSFCPRVEVVPTVVDTSIYQSKLLPRSKPVRVGWLGTPSTWSEYMSELLPALMPTLESLDSRFAVMGAAGNTLAHDRIDLEQWSEVAEVPFLQGLDIGVMPLTATPWAQGKCGYKLIQYMACGLPVVASPVGVNCEIVEHGVNGFLAETHDDWRKAIATLIANPDLRVQMGQAGRAKVEQSYSLQVWGPTVANILKSVVG